jgi:hypothetical protein
VERVPSSVWSLRGSGVLHFVQLAAAGGFSV